MMMTRKEFEQEIVRISGLETGAEYIDAVTKVTNVLEHMAGRDYSQLERYSASEDHLMLYTGLEFPSINYADSCMLHNVYVTCEDQEMQAMIENIVIASVAMAIVRKSKAQLRDSALHLIHPDEVLWRMISDCILNTRNAVRYGKYDPTKGASYTTYINGNIESWTLKSEWAAFREMYNFRTRKVTWVKVKRMMQKCTENGMEVTPENVHELMKQCAKENPSYECCKLSTVQAAMEEITRTRAYSLDAMIGNDSEDDGYTILRTTEEDLTFTSEVEKSLLSEELIMEGLGENGLLPGEDAESAMEQKVYSNLMFDAATCPNAQWFVEFLFRTVFEKGEEFGDEVKCIRKAVKAFREETNANRSQTEIFRRDIICFLSSLKNRRTQVLDLITADPEDDEMPGQIDYNFDEYWDSLIGG